MSRTTPKLYTPDPRPSELPGKPPLTCSDSYPTWIKLGAIVRVKTNPTTRRGLPCTPPRWGDRSDSALWPGELGIVDLQVREHNAEYSASDGDHGRGWFSYHIVFDRHRTLSCYARDPLHDDTQHLRLATKEEVARMGTCHTIKYIAERLASLASSTSLK